MSQKRSCVFIGAMLLASMMGSMARADAVLCAGSKDNPDNGRPWQMICTGKDYVAYGEAQVEPNQSGGGKVTLHVSDHHDCGDGTHFECGVAGDWDQELTCVDYDVTLDYTGYLSSVYMFCGCYSDSCYGQ